MVVDMAQFGSALATRAAGRRAYEAVVEQTSGLSGVVTFDFSGVSSITNSFADEVFGRLAQELGMEELRRRTTFRGIDTFWAQVVRNAMDARVCATA